ncbi:hypothetical protein T10_9232 [Trichinella papuae]|uniref:Uncharacterized protein n=1 Tax=Trichinella papuae TaxID=268474 RepID=A0A0V1N9J6_9BILA|nr:hypothetical protein T10_9232 [Trichinella papuae]
MKAAKGSILVSCIYFTYSVADEIIIEMWLKIFSSYRIGKVEYHYYIIKVKLMKQKKGENADDTKQITDGT